MMMKNCIVLMDEIGAQIAAGADPASALVSSSESRLRPVMMASLTTILGMIPLLGDAMFGSMAATIMADCCSAPSPRSSSCRFSMRCSLKSG